MTACLQGEMLVHRTVCPYHSVWQLALALHASVITYLTQLSEGTEEEEDWGGLKGGQVLSETTGILK